MPGPSDGEHQAWPTRAVVVALAVVAAVILVGLGLSRQHGSTTADPGTTPRSSVSGTTPGGTTPGGTTPQSTAPGRAASRLPGGRSIVPGTQRSPGPAPVPRSPGTASHPATSRRTAAQHPSSPPPRTAQVPTGALAQPVTVLNNTTITGLAARASQTLHGRGWTIAGTGNYQGRLATTTAYYDPGNATQQQAAAALARQFPQITAVQPRLSGLPGSGLTVVVAPNWPS